jgi:hypothetical protein
MTEAMTHDQRRKLRRGALSGLLGLGGVYVVVVAIDRGRDVAAFSVVYALFVGWPAWRYVIAPLIDSARGRTATVTGPVRFAKGTKRGGDRRFVYVGNRRLRVASTAQLDHLVPERSYLLRYAPITRIVLDLRAEGTTPSADG